MKSVCSLDDAESVSYLPPCDCPPLCNSVDYNVQSASGDFKAKEFQITPFLWVLMFVWLSLSCQWTDGYCQCHTIKQVFMLLSMSCKWSYVHIAVNVIEGRYSSYCHCHASAQMLCYCNLHSNGQMFMLLELSCQLADGYCQCQVLREMFMLLSLSCKWADVHNCYQCNTSGQMYLLLSLSCK